MMKMTGKRFPDGDGLMPPGGYRRDERGDWVICCPNGLLGNLRNHNVIEHEDGTITVSPSIEVKLIGPSPMRFHGYLEHGNWREA